MTRMLRAGAWLVIPLCAMLFLQWPMREWLPGAWARRANDMGQILFAVYSVLSIAAATLQGCHVAARGRWKSVRARAQACVALLLPWAVFMVAVGLPGVWWSVHGLEQFPDTLNPGYFLIRVAMLLLPMLAVATAVRRASARPYDDA